MSRRKDLDALPLNTEARRQCEKLPAECLAYVETLDEGNRIVLIRRGQQGYICTRYDHPGLSPITVQSIVREVNQKLGVSPSQCKAMLVGSMYGWDNPDADAAQHQQLDGEAILAAMPITGRTH